MKKVIWIVVVVLVVLFISGSCSAYNRMVTAEESVNTTWADVEAQYQRRSDLIPNLVNTVKGYAAHEQATFTEVVEARAQAMSFKLDAADLTPEKQVQTGCSGPDAREAGRVSAGAAEGGIGSGTSDRRCGAISRLEGQPEFPGAASPTGRNGKPDRRGPHTLQRCDPAV